MFFKNKDKIGEKIDEMSIFLGLTENEKNDFEGQTY